MEALNNKILYKVLDEEYQPKKNIFTPNADLLKYAEVISIGEKVEFVKKGDIISIYVHDMNRVDSEVGFCSDRSVIFKNGIPQKGKIHITNIENNPMNSFSKGEVIKSNSDDVEPGDIIYFKSGQSHILPDHTEIISETQVYYK
jgi:exosome complex RNA-binding protein Csl4